MKKQFNLSDEILLVEIIDYEGVCHIIHNTRFVKTYVVDIQ